MWFNKSNIIFSDNRICSEATLTRNGIRTWDNSERFKKYIEEAKRRRLSCGVDEDNEKERKAIEEKNVLAEEKARKKKIALEEKKKKQQKARKKKLAEQERKRKLEQEKIAQK